MISRQTHFAIRLLGERLVKQQHHSHLDKLSNYTQGIKAGIEVCIQHVKDLLKENKKG